MASNIEFVQYCCDQLKECGNVTYKKMFGEFMVYVNCKPVITICDNTAFVKINDVTSAIIPNNEVQEPYGGAKPHYILDVDNRQLLCQVVLELEKVTPLPKKRTAKQ